MTKVDGGMFLISKSEEVRTRDGIHFHGGGGNQILREGKIAFVTSFYDSEFPDTYCARDLFQLFGCEGTVAEVFISPKRNGIGKRFGFARFSEVEDGRLLAVRLDNILILGKKIHVNLPRFARGVGKVGGKSFISTKGLHASSGGFAERKNEGMNFKKESRRENRSYADIVMGSGTKAAKMQGYKASFSYNSCEEQKMRLQKAFVGKTILPGAAYNVHVHMEMEGIFAVKVSPLGGNLCLLEELEKGYIEDFLGSNDCWWSLWFSEVKRWDADSVDEHRDAWVRVYCIPAIAWQSEFFVSLAES
ncbi:uncharacterized protein LOC131620160 [Vicia villosa]|uniref:uncharacterized protein LOC131620160 n=1 Tax=Vicia villosa TaxID=3911 RepID=UPI00273BCFCB|nr:uncharacterized protein LOC131620160 [Vicia villosa]